MNRKQGLLATLALLIAAGAQAQERAIEIVPMAPVANEIKGALPEGRALTASTAGAGDLRFNTVSGDISGERLAGAVRLNTVSGDIDFEESNLPSVSVSTVSGEVTMETGLGEGPYSFKSVSGDLTLKVPADAHLSAELQTLSGDLSVKLPVTLMSRRNGKQSVEAQGGGVRVSLNSVSGDMRIKS